MKLNSSQLDAFFAVARLRHFTKAAESLHVTQSALSQRIAKLEEDLGVTLFIRERNAIRLTEVGEKVLRYCQLQDSAESDLLHQLKDSFQDFAGIVRIAGFSSVNRSLVIPALAHLMKSNPRLSIQLLTKELHELENLLKSAEVDYIITNKESESSDIENIFLGYEDNVLVQSKQSESQDIYLDHDENDTVTSFYFSQNKMKLRPKNIRYLDDVYGLIDGVKSGYGKAVLPLHLIKNEKDLEIIEPKKILRVAVFLQFYIQPYYRRIHSDLVKAIQEHLKKHLRQAANERH